MSFSLGSLAGGAAQGFQSEQQIAMQKQAQQQEQLFRYLFPV